MRRLTRARKLWRQLATPGFADRGGVAVIVSVLLAGGVLLGMAALSVDVGQLNAEREELISAADASARSIAIECGQAPVNCEGASYAGVEARAQDFANANGKDGRNGITVICGNGGTGSAIPPCDDVEPTNLTACLNTPPTNIKYVEVHTATVTASGSTVLPTAFAGSFVSGYQGGRVGACSRVEWGPPAGGLSLTFALCEWQNDTDHGNDLVDYPPNLPDASAEHVIYVHGPGATSCTNAPPSGWDAPGGFGWLDPDGGNGCFTSIQSDNSYPGNTGGITNYCLDAISKAQTNRTVVLIPVYDGTKGTGSKMTYDAAGIVAFVITGYYFDNSPKDDVASWLTGRRLCSNNDRCVYGFFVSALLPANTPIDPSGANLGATVIKTVG